MKFCTAVSGRFVVTPTTVVQRFATRICLCDVTVLIVVSLTSSSHQLLHHCTLQVVVIGHHPVGGSCIVRESRWWEELMAEFGDVVALHVSGHTHNDHFRLVSALPLPCEKMLRKTHKQI